MPATMRGAFFLTKPSSSAGVCGGEKALPAVLIFKVRQNCQMSRHEPLYPSYELNTHCFIVQKLNIKYLNATCPGFGVGVKCFLFSCLLYFLNKSSAKRAVYRYVIGYSF
jgi:hypothetical protein